MVSDPEKQRPFPESAEESLRKILDQPEVKTASWLERIYTNTFGIFFVGLRQIWDRFDEMISNWGRTAQDASKTYNQNVALPFMRMFIDWGRSAGFMDDRTAEVIEKLKPDAPIIDLLYSLFVGGSLLKNYLGTASQGMSGRLIQQLNKDYRPNLPDPNSAVQAAFIAPEKTSEVREILKRSGLKDTDIDLLFIARYQLYDIQTVMTLYLRKLIDKDKAYERMREMGFTDTRIAEIMSTWEIIPGPQDLLMMVAKEAFEPDEIARYNLAEEFPEAQSEWLTKQGLSRFWQEKYWIAHWNYPSYQQVLDLLYRGLIKEEDVWEFYRIIEIPTYWRNLLIKASYQPYTRVDTRRMHAMGVLNDDDLLKAYMAQGYDEEHAGKMSEFTKRYNSQDKTNITSSQIIKAYRNSMITRDDAASLLASIKKNADETEWLLINADFEEGLELQNLYLNAIKTKYLDLIIGDLDARTELTKLNLPGARIDALMGAWIATREAKTKLPSKTDLDKFLKAKIIDADQYKTEMYRLGYTYQYTDWYLQSNTGTTPTKTTSPTGV